MEIINKDSLGHIDCINQVALLSEENPHPVIGLAKDGKVQYTNTAGKNLLEKMGGHLYSSLPEPFCQTILKQHNPDTVKQMEVEIKDSIYSILVFSGEIFHHDYIYLFGYDITENKCIERELQYSEKRFLDIMEITGDWIWETDDQGRYTYVNSMCESILGLKSEQILGSFYYSFYHPLYKDELIKSSKLVLKQRKPFKDFVHTNMKADGNSVVLETSGVPVYDEFSHFKGYRGASRDITKRKEVEESLQYLSDFELLISKISTNFINLQANEVDVGIEIALSIIGDFVKVDRSYVFQFHDNGKKMDNTHEWCAYGVEPQIHNLKNLDTDIFPWWMDKLNQNEVINISNVNQLPEVASAEKEILQAQSILSLIVVPMYNRGKLIGYLGFDCLKEEKKWQPESIKLLRMVGEIFSNALEHKKSVEILEYRIRFEKIIKNISRRFINIKPKEMDTEIELTLMIICLFLEVDAGFVFTKNNHLPWVKTHHWIWDSLNLGKTGFKENYATQLINQCLDSHSTGIINVSNIHEMTVDFPLDPVLIKESEIKSFIIVPLIYDEAQFGRLAFFSIKAIKTWWEEDITLLKTIGDIFVNALFRRKAEEDLQKIKDNLLRAQEIAHFGSWEWDLTHNEMICSDELYRLFEVPPNQFTPSYENMLKLIVPKNRANLRKTISSIIVGEIKHAKMDISLNKDNAPEKMLQLQIEGITNIKGEVIKIIGTALDITQRKKDEQRQQDLMKELEKVYLQVQEKNIELNHTIEKLEEARQEAESAKKTAEQHNRLKSEFLANMSHELRTPLNAIIGFSDAQILNQILHNLIHFLIQKNPQLSDQTGLNDIIKNHPSTHWSDDVIEELEEQLLYSLSSDYKSFASSIIEILIMKGDIEKIHRNGQRLLLLINDILDLSKIEAGKMLLVKEEFNLKPLMETIVKDSGIALAEKQNLTLLMENKDCYIYADKNKVQQIILNVLSNAIKFTPPGGKVHIESGEWGAKVYIKITDTGIGISKEMQKTIFEKFNQGDSTTTKLYGGTGLGLAISKRLMDMHSGCIQVESELNKGSTFTLLFPKAYLHIPKILDEKKVILILEDDQEAAELIKREVESAGFIPIVLHNHQNLLEVLDKITPLYLTLDLNLSTISGEEILEQLKNNPKTRDIPIIIISMQDPDSIQPHNLKKAITFIQKPINGQLMQLLSRHYTID